MTRWGQRVAVVAVSLYLIILYFNNPEKGGFLSCPFRLFTGLLCPGCGSQRAVHDLLHLRIGEAFAHNGLLVVAVPLLALQWGYSRLNTGDKPLSARNWVVWSWAVLVVGWGIFRNLPLSLVHEH